MTRLLHVSDVHFGPPHLPRVAEGVLELARQRRPDVVVVSGDLTQRAKPRQFRRAREWVDRMPVPAVVVPGNHDVPMYRFWERALTPFGAYRRHFSRELEPVHRDDGLVIVGVNTAYNWTIKGGRIRLSRLLEVGEMLEGEPDGVIKVVVAHHDLLPPPGAASQRVLANADEAIDVFSAAGVDLVLSGHNHQAYIGTSEVHVAPGGPSVLICHSGTTTSSRGRRCERGVNSCNWIEIGPRELEVTTLRWDTEGETFRQHRRRSFPRQRPQPAGEAAG